LQSWGGWIQLDNQKKFLLASGLDVAIVAAEYKFLNRLLDILKKAYIAYVFFFSKK